MDLLIIDGDHICNCVTQRLAKTSGLFATIRTLRYEKHALEFLEQTKNDSNLTPDVIILNLDIQGISPAELFDALREVIVQSAKRIHLAILTLTADHEVADCVRTSGLQPYLLKPFSSPELHMMVHAFKSRQRNERYALSN